MKSIKELREESKGHTRLLYHLGYWDGPHDGVMLWEGERAYFHSYGDDERVNPEKWTDEEIEEWKETCKEREWEFNPDRDCVEWEWRRYFKVYRIPEKLMDDIDNDHNLFRKYVGTHTDYNCDGQRERGANKDLGGLMPYHICMTNSIRPNEKGIRNLI